MTDYLKVSVAYIGSNGHFMRAVEAPKGTCVREAIDLAGVLDRFPEIDLASNKVGIFGKVSKLDQILEEGDRVEIYRPLIADPREARKRRATGAKAH